MINEEEFLNWLNSPATKWLMGILKQHRQYLMEQWAEGMLPEGSDEAFQLRAMIYQDIVDATYADWITHEDVHL